MAREHKKLTDEEKLKLKIEKENMRLDKFGSQISGLGAWGKKNDGVSETAIVNYILSELDEDIITDTTVKNKISEFLEKNNYPHETLTSELVKSVYEKVRPEYKTPDNSFFMNLVPQSKSHFIMKDQPVPSTESESDQMDSLIEKTDDTPTVEIVDLKGDVVLNDELSDKFADDSISDNDLGVDSSLTIQSDKLTHTEDTETIEFIEKVEVIDDKKTSYKNDVVLSDKKADDNLTLNNNNVEMTDISYNAKESHILYDEAPNDFKNLYSIVKLKNLITDDMIKYVLSIETKKGKDSNFEGLSDRERIIIIYFIMKKSLFIRESQADIRFNTNIPERRFIDSINKLKTYGWVEIDGKTTPNTYITNEFYKRYLEDRQVFNLSMNSFFTLLFENEVEICIKMASDTALKNTVDILTSYFKLYTGSEISEGESDNTAVIKLSTTEFYGIRKVLFYSFLSRFDNKLNIKRVKDIIRYVEEGKNQKLIYSVYYTNYKRENGKSEIQDLWRYTLAAMEKDENYYESILDPEKAGEILDIIKYFEQLSIRSDKDIINEIMNNGMESFRNKFIFLGIKLNFEKDPVKAMEKISNHIKNAKKLTDETLAIYNIFEKSYREQI